MLVSPHASASQLGGNPLATEAEEDELCLMMKDLLLTGLSTREDFLVLGFTEAELDAASRKLDAASPSLAVAEEHTEAQVTPSGKPSRGAVLGWTPGTVLTRSHLQRTPLTSTPRSPPGSRVRPREASPVQRIACVHNEEDEDVANSSGAHRGVVTDTSERGDNEVDAPAACEPLTEAKRLERQRDARQAQRFSDCLAKANGATSPLSPTRALFDRAPATEVTVAGGNSALKFTVEDAMAAKEMNRILLSRHLSCGGGGDDARTMSDFMEERATLSECYM